MTFPLFSAGDHVIHYALYPHTGPLYSSNLAQHATNYNSPLSLVTAPNTADDVCMPLNMKTKDTDGVVVQAIKKVCL